MPGAPTRSRGGCTHPARRRDRQARRRRCGRRHRRRRCARNSHRSREQVHAQPGPGQAQRAPVRRVGQFVRRDVSVATLSLWHVDDAPRLYPAPARLRGSGRAPLAALSSRGFEPGRRSGLLRTVACAAYEDVRLVWPGLVYRRDRIDRLSVGEPHQLDLWRLCRRALHRDDLESMVAVVVGALVPGAAYRCLPAVHPYTCDGLEVEVRAGETWVELLECGLAAPDVLSRAGLPAHYTGLAMGIGLDRALMMRKGIDDIRLLRSSDTRVTSQMCDLEPYRPVSSQPPVRRDLPIAVAAQTPPEELGDR